MSQQLAGGIHDLPVAQVALLDYCGLDHPAEGRNFPRLKASHSPT